MINVVDRVAISVGTEPITRELGLNPAQWGLVLGVFFVGLVPATIATGYLADRHGARRWQLIGATSWSLLTAATTLVNSFGALLVVRFLFGVGEGPGGSVGGRVIANWIPARQRGRTFSMIMVGIQLAPALGVPLIAWIMVELGWRPAFLILGGVGLLWVLAWRVIFTDDPARNRFVGERELAVIQRGITTPEHLRAVPETGLRPDRMRTLAGCFWGMFCTGYLLYFLLTWLPGYFSMARGLDLKQMGVAASLPWLGGVLGVLLGGLLTDRILARTGRFRWARAYPASAALLVSAIGLYICASAVSLPAAIALLALVSFCLGWIGPVLSSVVLDVTWRRAGLFSGVSQALEATAGVVAPVLTGVIVNRSGSFDLAFTIAALVAASGAVAVFGLVRHAGDASTAPERQKESR
ncbi:MFS transporter [Pseudonocardia acaciae]|uniref:MFS transporter n=1 Tax=Pseudonocardia acaciae TaxID=551276 RepID=UPI00048E234A|nr:MFS transporter [Pseudonocardia acaciae]